MAGKAPLESLRDRFLELQVEARELGEHQVAYHVLCAALHAAESMEDVATCRLIEERAGEYREWLDANHPGHNLSSRSAAARGHESIFKQLATLAASARLRMEIDARKRKGRP